MKKAYVKALRRLGRRDYSVDEMRRALTRAGFVVDDVDAALARLVSEGFLDDARFAQGFARSRMTLRGHGRHRIRQALFQRGIDREVAEGGLLGALDEVSEDEILDRLARSYWNRKRRLEPRRRLASLRAFLLRRGFPADVVTPKLRALWPEWRADDPIPDLEEIA